MSKVHLSIEYAGLHLQVAKNEHGQDVTPLKPISDLFGLRWDRQRDKVTKSVSFGKYLGVCTLQMWGADGQKREQNCILLSRVAAYIMSISPDAIRSQGNHDAADFLEEKLNEWADALHDYEQIGIAINQNHVKFQEGLRKQRASFAQELLDLFFYEFFNINFLMNDGLNHSHNDQLIAINLTQTIKSFKENRINVPSRKHLVRVLQLHPSYFGNGSVKSKVWGNTAWCFLFKRG